MPQHNHGYEKFNYWSWTWGNNSGGYRVPYGNDENFNYSTTSNNTGGSQAHNNMPPYITAYCWRRYQ